MAVKYHGEKLITLALGGTIYYRGNLPWNFDPRKLRYYSKLPQYF
jgi:hypothetical protein